MTLTIVSLNKPYDAEFEVSYSITKYYPGSLDTPEEKEGIEIHWVKPLECYSEEEGYNEWIENDEYEDQVYEELLNNLGRI
jgi:hypothetical protein